MTKKILYLALFSISTLSCAQETPKVKHADKQKLSSKLNIKDLKVVNEEDPVCHMKTSEFLKDTAIYKGKVYGFCNTYCKQEFKKEPKKYSKN